MPMRQLSARKRSHCSRAIFSFCTEKALKLSGVFTFYLATDERFKSRRGVLGGFKNGLHLLLEQKVFLRHGLQFDSGGVADKGVAGADVEVDVRQRLDAEIGVVGSGSTWAASLRKRRSLQISTASSMMSTP